MLAYRAPEVLRIKVLVSFADAMTANLLAAELQRDDQLDVIECSPAAESIFAALLEETPNILLLGTKSREDTFARLPMLRRIRNEHPNTRTIVCLDESARDLVAELFRAGVRGVFNRSEYGTKRLCHCIACVASGQIWANSEQLAFVLDVFAATASLNVLNATGAEMLTPREKDVVRLVVEGFSNREIAHQLGLSVHTVKNYIFNIFEKVGISSRAELVMYVLANSDNKISPADDSARSRDRLPVVNYRLKPKEVPKRVGSQVDLTSN